MIPLDDFTFTADLLIEAAWQRGYEGSRDAPDEPEGYELEGVFWKSVDITACLSDDDLRRIEERLMDEPQ